MFYEESGGGVTLSGGEVMAQDMDYIEQLLKKLKRKGYNVAIDTCGYAPQENYERVLPYVDTFLYDIKTMDPEKHEKYMGKDNELICQIFVSSVNVGQGFIFVFRSSVESMTRKKRWKQ